MKICCSDAYCEVLYKVPVPTIPNGGKGFNPAGAWQWLSQISLMLPSSFTDQSRWLAHCILNVLGQKQGQATLQWRQHQGQSSLMSLMRNSAKAGIGGIHGVLSPWVKILSLVHLALVCFFLASSKPPEPPVLSLGIVLSALHLAM